MMKKVLALLCACAMTFSLVACGGSETTDGDAGKDVAVEDGAKDEEGKDDSKASYPAETVKIGVEIYDPTDSEFMELKAYFDYLSENMNVEFVYSEAIKDAAGEMKFIEDCAMAGCKGILAYYNVSGAQQPLKAMELGMYFWGGAEDAAITEAAAGNPLYLGSVHAGNFEYEAGKAIGEWAVAQGFKKVIYAAGGAQFGVPMFVNRQNGFMDAVSASGMEVITVNGFPSDQFYADQSAALAEEGVEAVCASFNGVDFWAQPIEAAGLKGKVKLGTLGSVNQNYVDCFESGIVDMVAAKNIQMFALAVPMICNAVDGNAEAIKAEGATHTDVAAPGWIITNAADAAALYEAQSTNQIITIEDLMSVCVANNPDASAQTIEDILAKTSMEAILAK